MVLNLSNVKVRGKKWVTVVSIFGMISLAIIIPFIIQNYNHVEEPSILMIEITNDYDFTNYDFPGQGTKVDPYIIENYTILTSNNYAIHICNTSKFFVIQNCYLKAQTNGLFIENIANGTARIYHNECYNNIKCGINIIESYNILLKNNYCSGNKYGILLNSTANSIIEDNCCLNNVFGITLDNSFNNTIANNLCYNNKDGINIKTSLYNNLTKNNCFYCSQTGIFLDSSQNDFIDNNQIQNNRGYGIFIENSLNSIFIKNEFYNNTIDIYLVNSLSITINNSSFNNNFRSYCVSILHTNDIILTNNYFFKYNQGISLYESYNTSIIDNTFDYGCYGVQILGCFNTYIKGNSFIENIGSAVSVPFTSPINTTIINNSFINNRIGIETSNGYNYLITNNTFVIDDSGIRVRSAISLAYSPINITITNNIFNGCGLDFTYIKYTTCLTFIIENNTMNGKQIGYFVDNSYPLVSESIYGQLILINCSNIIIRNYDFYDTTNSIVILYCTNIVIENNRIMVDKSCPIYVKDSTNITITKNIITNNTYGIFILNTDNIRIINNTCTNLKDTILYLFNCSQILLKNNVCKNNVGRVAIINSSFITIDNNTLSKGSVGIEIYNSFNVEIKFNKIYYYSYWGIIISGPCNNIVISNNTLFYNTGGIWIHNSNSTIIKFNIFKENTERAISITEGSFNIIHHNNFINNNIGDAYQAYDFGVFNQWYDTTTAEGNYWSDWIGYGTYRIGGYANTIDPHPLQYPVVI
ncbi:MAG: hypothetical protein FK734_21505 [Asgard group archaeon]|nr:hypothetical protein [Asgard group archaeon]